MEVPEKRMKEAVSALVDDVDNNYLRAMQKQMFLCSSNCYDMGIHRDNVEKCVERCNHPVKQATDILQRELDDLQGQLNRCAMTCYDKAQQKFGPDPAKYTTSDNEKFNDHISKCICSCVDDHIKLLPNIRKRVVDSYQHLKK